jgi:cobyrinic acid a,c-diamide synthase
MYEENLEMLRALGCTPVFFSPLRDKTLPEGISGIFICGGYPELYAGALSENTAMRDDVRRALAGGLPVIAEGGGFLYLHETLDDYPMCGVIKGAAFKTDKLQRFGYITLTAARDNLLCKAGGSIRSREFHYWESDCPGDGFTAEKAGSDAFYHCVHTTDTLYAGFPHLYFPANPSFAMRFAEKCHRANKYP